MQQCRVGRDPDRYPYILYLRCALGTEPTVPCDVGEDRLTPLPEFGNGRMSVVGRYNSYRSMVESAMQLMAHLHAPRARWKDLFTWGRDR